MNNTNTTVIAIDGPAASGKSSVARELATTLGFSYVNTGAMYRAATWFVLQQEIVSTVPESVAACLLNADIETGFIHKVSYIKLNGIDPDPFLNDQPINDNVSTIASVPAVRELLVNRQRALAQTVSVVMEGRDIGTVVFPETPYKFYIDASPEVRRQRRAAQGHVDDPSARDKADSTRRASPLMIAEDAEVIDSSHLTIDGVVGEIIGRLKQKGFHIERPLFY